MGRKGVLLAAALSLAALLAACAPAGGGAAAPAEPSGGFAVDTLRLEGGTDWGPPSPFLNVSRGPGTANMRLAFASLLEKDETGDVPWLAERWSIDGKDYTFTLFEGAEFHDGRPLTSEDVAFTLDYYRSHPPVSNPLGAGEEYLVEGCTVKDQRTITITVKEVTADTLADLGAFVVLPKHIWSQVEDPYSYTGEGYLVGSGAYRCTYYDGASGGYEFTAFEGWPNGRQAAERVQFVPVSDAVLAFEQGEIDIVTAPVDLLDRYREDSAVGLIEKAGDYGYKLLINFERHPDFLDLELRKALYGALDRAAVVERVFRGAGSVGSAGCVPEGNPAYYGGVARYEYDPEGARAALGEKGYAMTLLVGDSGDDLAIAELLRNDLESAGIGVRVLSYDAVTRDHMVNAGEYDLALVGNGGWSSNPPSYLRSTFSDQVKNQGGNPHTMGPLGYSSEAVTALAEAQRLETDAQARLALFHDLQELVSREIPLIVVANRSTYSIYRRDRYDGWMKTYAYQQAEQNRLSYMER